jgi:hypothetical protein
MSARPMQRSVNLVSFGLLEFGLVRQMGAGHDPNHNPIALAIRWLCCAESIRHRASWDAGED